jgi:hypothetical protein
MGSFMDFLEVHAAHAAAARHRRSRRLVLRLLGDHRFGRDEERGNRGCVLKSGAHDLEIINVSDTYYTLPKGAR